MNQIHTVLLLSNVNHPLSDGLCLLNSLSIAGLISPWNLPLYLLTWKIAPAVATGNTVVAKPSEMTSVTAWMMCQLLEEAGEGFVCVSGTDLLISSSQGTLVALFFSY